MSERLDHLLGRATGLRRDADDPLRFAVPPQGGFERVQVRVG